MQWYDVQRCNISGNGAIGAKLLDFAQRVTVSVPIILIYFYFTMPLIYLSYTVPDALDVWMHKKDQQTVITWKVS